MTTLYSACTLLLCAAVLVTMAAQVSAEIEAILEIMEYIRVEYFTREICGTTRGRDLFLRKMKTRLCGLTDRFIARHIMVLCRQREALLDWVRELYDNDSDGYISYREKQSFYHPPFIRG